MKKIALATSLLLSLNASVANATLYDIEMNASLYIPSANGPLLMVGFEGIWNSESNSGYWKGTTAIPGFNSIIHYSQTFRMNEATGEGTLDQFDLSTCTDNAPFPGSNCNSLHSSLLGRLKNTVVNPADINAYKTEVPFTPANEWTGQWTLQVMRTVPDGSGGSTFEYLPVLMNVTLRELGGPPPVPVPAAAWLFSSGLIGLAGIGKRRRKSVN